MTAALGRFLLIPLLVAGFHVAATGSTLKPDESVILIPTYAIQTKDGGWLANVHAWVFEQEEDSTLRRWLRNAVADYVDLPDRGAKRQRFEQRSSSFLVDNERHKSLRIQLDERRYELNPTAANGHSHSQLHLPPCPQTNAEQQECSGWIEYRLLDNDGRNRNGRVNRIPPRGLSILSDIDDTIKDSQVMDSAAMLRIAFLEAYAPIPGMACLYRQWDDDQIEFHYVSSTPWQLYPWLSQFIQDYRFPPGVIHLLPYRLTDRNLLNLLRSPMRKKYPLLARILDDFPQRRFVLVGDSGQSDPEIYAALARAYPEQVERIYIRAVPGSDLTPERWRRTFSGPGMARWQLFHDVSELTPGC